MFEAARAGDLGAIETQLANGADVHARDAGDNATALHWAAASGALDVVQRLVEAGADVSADGDDHALHVIGWATCFDEAHAHVAEFLVQRGARHHLFSAIALDLADEVRALVAQDPGALHRRMSHNENHQLPLHFAVRKQHAGMVALLIELGADPLGVDAWGHTAPACAVNPAIDRPILAAILALGSSAGSHVRAHRALALGDGNEPGTLHLLAKRGDTVGVQRLLDDGANPDALWSHWGAEVTPMHLAAAYGHEDAVRTLWSAGADPNLRDSQHDSDPLGWAQHFGQAAIVDLLSQRETSGGTSVLLEFSEDDPHVPEIVDAFEDAWIAGIATQAGLVRLALQTPGETWGAAVTLVEARLDRLAFDWRSHAHCRRP